MSLNRQYSSIVYRSNSVIDGDHRARNQARNQSMQRLKVYDGDREFTEVAKVYGN
jgi:hypothetical protein